MISFIVYSIVISFVVIFSFFVSDTPKNISPYSHAHSNYALYLLEESILICQPCSIMMLVHLFSHYLHDKLYNIPSNSIYFYGNTVCSNVILLEHCSKAINGYPLCWYILIKLYKFFYFTSITFTSISSYFGNSYLHYGCVNGCDDGTVNIALWLVNVLTKYPKLCTFYNKVAIIITFG